MFTFLLLCIFISALVFPVSPPESLLHCHHANGQGCGHQRGGQANIQRKRQWPKGKLSYLPQYKLVRHQKFEKNQRSLVILAIKIDKTFRLCWLYNLKFMPWNRFYFSNGQQGANSLVSLVKTHLFTLVFKIFAAIYKEMLHFLQVRNGQLCLLVI